MKRYKMSIFIIIILCIMLINNGCLTMQYYPARVAKPGKILLGVGLDAEYEDSITNLYGTTFGVYSGFFIRYGLPYNFDIGFSIHSMSIFPYILSIGVGKQFDLNNNLIHSIIFNTGYGTNLDLTELYTSVSITKNIFAFTVGYQFIKGEISDRNGSDIYYRASGFLIKISSESKYERFNVTPFLYCRMIKSHYIYSFPRLFYEIGIGISFYFDLL